MERAIPDEQRKLVWGTPCRNSATKIKDLSGPFAPTQAVFACVGQRANWITVFPTSLNPPETLARSLSRRSPTQAREAYVGHPSIIVSPLSGPPADFTVYRLQDSRVGGDRSRLPKLATCPLEQSRSERGVGAAHGFH